MAQKRAGSFASPDAKRQRVTSAYSLPAQPATPAEAEEALWLPEANLSEEDIASCIVVTNRAPLLMAFAYVLLGFTMPEQPRSSRLSLAEALVAGNARGKARTLGIEGGRTAGAEVANDWGHGQPSVRIMGREVKVLKRGGYPVNQVHPPAEEVKTEQGVDDTHVVSDQAGDDAAHWVASTSRSLKSSTFIAHAHSITSASQATSLLSTLPESCHDATHNISAYRVTPKSTDKLREHSDDDGESRGGAFLLNILREHQLDNVLLVVSRWYGGVFLGPDRWRLMGDVAREALAARLRVSSDVPAQHRTEALWGIDEDSRTGDTRAALDMGIGIPVHVPERARQYLLKAFTTQPAADVSADASASSTADASVSSPVTKKRKAKTGAQIEQETTQNLSLVLGALESLFASWAGKVSVAELDGRAWSWYLSVRPEVDAGVKGWGAKGTVHLEHILKLKWK